MANHARGKISVGKEDTGTFEALGSNDELDVTTTDVDPNVYGLDVTDKSQDVLVRQNRRSRVLFICIAIIAVLAITRHLTGFPSIRHLRRLMHGNQTTQSQTAQPAQEQQAEEQEQEQAEQEQQEEPAPDESAQEEEDLSGTILFFASTLNFAGVDLSLPEDELLIEASQGRVQVTHQPSGSLGDSTQLAGNAAMRAAALCNAIGGQEVIGDGETEGFPLAEVTWIVRNANGESYLAVSFAPGTAPTEGSGIEVLAQSPCYRLSDSVYRSLAGVISQGTEAVPTLLSGEEIWPSAKMPQ